MKKKYQNPTAWRHGWLRKLFKTMKLTFMLILVSTMLVSAGVYSQNTRLSLNYKNIGIGELLQLIEKQTEFRFAYSRSSLDPNEKVTIDVENENLEQILGTILDKNQLTYKIFDRYIVISDKSSTRENNNMQQPLKISGRVTDSSGSPLPGVTVAIKGTTQGTITDSGGNYALPNVSGDGTLVFSFVGMKTQEIAVSGKATVNVAMAEEMIGLEEVVAIGYGTMKKSDLTGSVVRADIESFRESPNVSVIQSLHGSVAGLNVGQITSAGEEPDILIRGKSSISGELAPLIVVDNIIFRGNLIDLNPNDIESIDILKDASSAAIYGSQASNGVILITTKRSGGIKGKPTFNYSGYYSFQGPTKELRPGSPENFMKKTEESDIFNSRTAESGYLERNPTWDPTSNFKTTEEIAAYNQGRSTDWYSLLTNDNMYIQSHNLSLANKTKYNNYLISLGYTEQIGYMMNDDYSRINARINVDNNITNWLQISIQSFMTSSDYSGQDINPSYRYFSPYATVYDENDELVLFPNGSNVNPIIQAEADHFDKRLNFFGNISMNIDVPFVKGLSYKINFANNYRTRREYYFRSYENNFEGEGSKTETIGYDWSTDNILSFKHTFNNIHKLDVTLVYGVEKRKESYTQAVASVFTLMELGYNRLQAGSAELQQALSGAWEESSLYTMGRIFYGFKNKYLLTGTIRRDGFSGFSKNNKFGLFPSMSVAWVASEEPFIKERLSGLDQFKLRLSYGANGNRTISRYQTLARVSGGYNYITADGTPVYSQAIGSLASPNLKWETTTGINVGIDFGILNQRILGSVDYYNNNTTNLLYEVDLPGISRYQTFPDNLGKLHNHGLEFSLTSMNIKRPNFEWNSTFVFSRNRNELKELLGFDNDGDGIEDDLISEGLFIGESIDAIYTYKIDGKWQLGDDIPTGYDLGSNKVVDMTGEGEIDTDDKTIIGYSEPSYRFSINNSLRYKNWTFKFFINSVQGGKNYYLGEDDLLDFAIMNDLSHFNFNFPSGLDYWTPENPDARYQKPNINVSGGIAGTRYIQRNFVRLQDVSLSYDLPKTLINKFRVQNCKVYLSGKNLVTLTKWPGWDPETGVKITRGGLPVVKSYTIGVNIEF